MKNLLMSVVICMLLFSGCANTEKSSKPTEEKNNKTENQNKKKEESEMIAEQNSKTTFKIPETYDGKATANDLEQFKKLESLFNENQGTSLFYKEDGIGITIAYANYSNTDKKIALYGFLTNGTENIITDASFELDLVFKNHPEVPKKVVTITLNNSLIGDVDPNVTIPIVAIFNIPELQTEQAFFSGEEFTGSSVHDIKIKTKN